MSLQNLSNYQTGRTSFNVTLNQANDILTQIQAQGLDKGQPSAVFCETIAPPQGPGALMVPATADQDNGQARWVDTASGDDLTSQGIDPANDKVNLQIWLDVTQNYYDVGAILADMQRGDTLAQSLE